MYPLEEYDHRVRSDRDLPAVVGVGRIGVGLAAGGDDRQHHPAAKRRRRRVPGVGRRRDDRHRPRRREVQPLPARPQHVLLFALDLRRKTRRVTRSEIRHSWFLSKSEMKN